MAPWLVDIIITLAAFTAMECVAWLTHKYVMHGLGWFFHADHHHKTTIGFFERNDFFFLVFAIPGIFCLYIGMQLHFNFLFFTGLGITLYGFTYFFVHDIFIHQRFKIFRNSDSLYLRAIRRAHKMHHKHRDKYEGECFGMLWVPLKYFREAKKQVAK
jgi:beta-carotene 3-hydroxylase